jgi:hypothetical protein
MPSLQEQIAFVQKEHERYKCIQSFLLHEFGEKSTSLLTKENTKKTHYSSAILALLEELKTIKSLSHGFRK